MKAFWRRAGMPICLFTAHDPELRINRKSCNQLGLEPIYLGSKADKPENQYPAYEIITCKGITEVIEHRAMEPIFFVTDDPGVLRRLGLPRDSGYKDRLGMHG